MVFFFFFINAFLAFPLGDACISLSILQYPSPIEKLRCKGGEVFTELHVVHSFVCSFAVAFFLSDAFKCIFFLQFCFLREFLRYIISVAVFSYLRSFRKG